MSLILYHRQGCHSELPGVDKVHQIRSYIVQILDGDPEESVGIHVLAVSEGQVVCEHLLGSKYIARQVLARGPSVSA